MYLLIRQTDLITCTDSSSDYSQLNFNRELSSPQFTWWYLCARKGCQKIMRSLCIYFTNRKIDKKRDVLLYEQNSNNAKKIVIMTLRVTNDEKYLISIF